MKSMVSFAVYSCVFALVVYLAWAIDWDNHLDYPSYGELLDNVRSETAKTIEWNRQQFCADKPHDDACR